ncbi:Cro/C1-type helix-turn-helix DNA-binding protein [Microbacterium sp. AG1240]|uniref:helix-turn-helix domain-containing protein n=1 Tax=Microbacterium sp. AG1240 TaxID=2183992 RepID=UPI000EB56DAD|nr:helix-turn-helix transcriptional regulator [Microbacterium sp. AG1240]RKT33624.1 Cro/C1-type helix-turn-helix DNA-binding protein [Microbacterium sp. AG1240]
MASEITPISRALSDVFTGLYKKRRLTQPVFSERSGIPEPTLQKKLKGNAPITATDLVVMARALGADPGDVLHEALKDLGMDSVSEAPISLDAHRKKPVDMTDEEVAKLRGAAGHDAELDEDEQGHP